MILVIFGPPGAGKGTQARLLVEQYDLTLISTGDLLRAEVKEGTELGKSIKQTMDEGGYPSEEIVLSVFERTLNTLRGKGLILDGIPRTLNQAEKVDELFKRLGTQIDRVIQLKVADEELIKRLSHRVICVKCGASYTDEVAPKESGVCDKCAGTEFVRRADDEPKAIEARLNIYNEMTKPLIDYYKKEGLLTAVDGMKSVEAVNKEIQEALKQTQVLTRQSGSLYSAQDI